MMSDDEIIAVVTAHKEGKKIQVRSKLPGHHDWNDCANDPGWAFDNLDYRVAPEPQAIYCEASVSQKRAEKAADEDGFTFPDEQRSGFIYGYKFYLRIQKMSYRLRSNDCFRTTKT